jgi:hypothetical protein
MTVQGPAVRCFMPHAEAQVGFGAPGHVPAKPVLRLARDIELLLGQLGTSDDILLTRRLPTPAHLDVLSAAGLTRPYCVAAELDHHVLPRTHPLRRIDGAWPQPWAWTPDTCHFFGPLRRGGAVVPRWESRRARIWSKAWAASLLTDLVRDGLGQPGGLGVAPLDVPVAVSDVADLAVALERLAAAGLQTAVVKAALASSGRGALRIACHGHAWTTSESRWLAKTLRAQGSVVVAPWRNRLADVSVQLDLDAADPVRGVTGLLCDPLGRYRGNLIHEPPLSAPHRACLLAVAAAVARALQDAGHVGHAGIDAMVFCDAAGNRQLQPLLEVNPRTTMGHVALGLRRQLPPGVEGELRLFGPRDLAGASATTFLTSLPTSQNVRAIPLSDPALASAHLALLFLGPCADRRAALG